MTINWQTVAKLWQIRDYQLRVKVTRGRNWKKAEFLLNENLFMNFRDKMGNNFPWKAKILMREFWISDSFENMTNLGFLENFDFRDIRTLNETMWFVSQGFVRFKFIFCVVVHLVRKVYISKYSLYCKHKHWPSARTIVRCMTLVNYEWL